MSNPQQETKIELVTEAIEALTLAQVIATNPACSEHERHIAVKNVGDARGCLSSALRELLTPTLRVVTSQRISEVGNVKSTLTRQVAEASVPA